MDRQSVWIIGDWQHPDFSAPIAYLQGRSLCRMFDCGAAACSEPRCGPSLALRVGVDGVGLHCEPDVVLLVQSRPGQLSQGEIDRLHAAAPLAHLVGLVGPWCEGELRSGRPWRGVVRVPWRAWESRLPHELGLDNGRQRRLERLPKTATETERLERSVASLQGHKRQGIAAIYTASRVTFESLQGALQVLGISALWQERMEEMPSAGPDLIIIDGWQNVADASSMIESNARLSVPPRILLLPFPRPEDATRAFEMNIAAVVAQPLLLADLAVIVGRYVSIAPS